MHSPRVHVLNVGLPATALGYTGHMTRYFLFYRLHFYALFLFLLLLWLINTAVAVLWALEAIRANLLF